MTVMRILSDPLLLGFPDPLNKILWSGSGLYSKYYVNKLKIVIPTYFPLVAHCIYLPLRELLIINVLFEKIALVNNRQEMGGAGSIKPGYRSKDTDL